MEILKQWKHYLQVLFATDPGKPPAVRVRTARLVWFGSRSDYKLDLLRLGGPNLDHYPLTRRVSQVWVDPFVPISGAVFGDFQFMVAFRYPTANHKILLLVRHCPFRKNWPAL